MQSKMYRFSLSVSIVRKNGEGEERPVGGRGEGEQRKGRGRIEGEEGEKRKEAGTKMSTSKC